MNASRIAVSVAMATYNGQDRIRRQLDSLASQSQLPAELVISDDKSEDDTLRIVEAFAKAAPFPVKVFRNENRLGYRRNFMRAASLCQSELISFCDQDDIWYPNKIAESIKPFDDPEVLLAYHNADVATPEGNRIGSLASRAGTQSIMTPMSPGPWLYALGFTQVFRRSLLQLIDLWPNSLDQNVSGQPMAHDQWFFFLASVFGKIAYLDEPLVAYVQHGANTYGWHMPGFWDRATRNFFNRSRQYERHARSAESRAAILEIAKDRLDGNWGERAATAGARYRNLSQYYAGRYRLYTASRLGERLMAFRAVLMQGGYAGGAWTLGRRSLVTDMCIGVPVGHQLPPHWLD